MEESNVINQPILNKNLLEKLKDLKNRPTFKKGIILSSLLIIALAIPLTVSLLQSTQQTSTNASYPKDDILHTNPRLKISQQNMSKDYQRFINKKTLPANQGNEKNKMTQWLRKARGLTSSAPVEGVIFENINVRLEYVSGPDDYEAEILTTDINLAKTQVEKYLMDQGFSKDAVCNSLGLTYYVNFNLRKTIAQDTPFDPNPLACQ
jgi:hypothetical protein